jgi:hypothetical protein
VRRLRRRAEGGIVLPLTALVIVAVTLLVALVVDIGQLRTDRRTNKSVADVAARAGIARLPYGPWSGVCTARRYLLDNAKGFTSFDPGSETWSNAAVPPTVFATTRCPANPLTPDATPCRPNDPTSWARLQATAGGGRFSVEIQSGYAMPDARFPEDTGRLDGGAPEEGSCDNLAVIITQRRPHLFAGVGGFPSGTSRVRSVGRKNAEETLDFVAALQLLEQHKCGVLQTGGANTRVIAQPFREYPGTIQIDSADDTGSCPQPILNAQATSGGPSVVACSANSTNRDCQPGVGNRPARIGIYAINLAKPAAEITTPFPSTYGDTAAVPSPRTSRKYADRRYRQNVLNLEAEVKGMLTGNSGRPPGCAIVLLNACTANGVTWLVLQQTDCNTLSAFFLVPGRTSAPNIWFNCDLDVTTPLTLSAANSTIVVTGQLKVGSAFTVTDPRKVYVGGQSSGARIGLDVGGSTSVLAINPGSTATCSARTGSGHANRLVVADGSMKVGSGATVRLCQTFVDLASGFDKVPAVDGNTPCQTSACATYTGTISVSSGAFVDWSAPNEISGRLPDASELATTNKFEDLALWTESGGNGNSMAGSSSTSMAGSFFMPNADAFNLAGGGSLPVYLSAQFIATSMKVTGGATVNLVPNPLDSIPTSIDRTLLVR